MSIIAAAGTSDPGLWFVTPTSEAAAAPFHFHRVAMDGRAPRRRSISRGAMHHGGGGGEQKQHRRPHGTVASRGYTHHGPPAPPPPPGYYTAELVLAFLFVAVSLALLPLVLPPLAPPPALLLLVPVGLLAVLVALAFVPLDAHSHLVGAAR